MCVCMHVCVYVCTYVGLCYARFSAVIMLKRDRLCIATKEQHYTQFGAREGESNAILADTRGFNAIVVPGGEARSPGAQDCPAYWSRPSALDATLSKYTNARPRNLLFHWIYGASQDKARLVLVNLRGAHQYRGGWEAETPGRPSMWCYVPLSWNIMLGGASGGRRRRRVVRETFRHG